MFSYRWLLTWDTTEVLEMGSLPELTADEVRERYPGAAVERLPDDHRFALQERRTKVARYDMVRK